MMKTILILLLVLAAPLSWAQRPTPDPSIDEQTINTADISQIEFDTKTGRLSFTVDKVRYVLDGYDSGTVYATAKVSANAVILNELRRVAKVTLSTYHLDRQQPNRVLKVVFKYDSLRP